MNGTIDLSSSSQDFSAAAVGDDEMKCADEDEYSWSETSDSCSCSSCSTCSICDICNADFRANVIENGKKNIYAEREFSSLERTRFPLSSLQEDQHNLRFSNKNENRYEKRKSVLYTTNRSSKNKHTNTSINDQEDTTLGDAILEPNYVMYSSGSDKEINSSLSSSVTSGMIKNADSSSEISSTENFNGLPVCPEKISPKHVKKVTFSAESCNRDKRRPFNSSVKVPWPGQCHGNFGAGGSKQRHDHLDSNTDLSSECIRLQTVLKNIDPFLLRSLMLHQLGKKDARTISTLGKMFPKKKYPLNTIHCVRCHNDYHPFTGGMHCKVTHPVNAIARLCQKDQLACYRCGVCKKVYWVNILEDDVSRIINHLGYCFLGTHSPTANDVSYFPLGPAKTCEDMGCIEFYV